MPLGVARILVIAVLLRDLICIAELEVIIILRLGGFEKADYVREAALIVIERAHHVVHEAGGEIAVFHKVAVVIAFGEGGIRLIHGARAFFKGFLHRLAGEIAHGVVGIVVV